MFRRIESHYTRYYADWRDAQGRRHRRAFSDSNRATDFQKEQQALAIIQRAAIQLAESIQHNRPARRRQYEPLLEAIEASYELTHTPPLRQRR
jgi:hypothetical protein